MLNWLDLPAAAVSAYAVYLGLAGDAYAIEWMSVAVMMQWVRQLRVLLLVPAVAPGVLVCGPTQMAKPPTVASSAH